MMAMATVSSKCTMKEVNRGGWTAEEDQKLAQAIEIHGPKRWKSVAAKAGLNRCGKSCRLRWMNYLRPNIKKGNISDQEEDLILRLHKMLGNRWSLIAGRLPGRTDNEIKNYWNCHLSKKLKPNEKLKRGSKMQQSVLETDTVPKGSEEGTSKRDDHFTSCFNIDNTSMDFYSEGSLNLEWTNQFPELDESWFNYS